MWLRFASPLWLIALILIPLMYYMYLQSQKRRKRDLIKFSNLALIKKSASNKRFNWRKNIVFYLTIISIAFLIIGLADPHIPMKRAKKGVNVVLALDISGSMQATDYKPTRLDAAKRSAKILLKELKVNDYAGIITFESGAMTAAYLSPAKKNVITKLEAIAPRQGRTAIGDGLSLAIDMASSIPNKKKIVILLSDGVSNAGIITPAEAVAFAKTNKVQVYTIALGSEGKAVLGYDWLGRAQYAELDETTLKAIAKNTDGKYFKSVDGKTLDNIYEDISKDINREKEDTSIKNFFIVLVILLMLIVLYIQHGKHRILKL